MEWNLTSSELVGAFVCESPLATAAKATLPILGSTTSAEKHRLVIETCATCDELDCVRHEKARTDRTENRAFLLDAFWPEFDRYVQQVRRESDWLLVPIDGTRWALPQYAWSRSGFAHVEDQTLRTLVRSLKSRRLGSQGAARQAEMLHSSAAMGLAMAGRIPSTVSHVVVDQTMLPALWRSGELGGRTFDVVMRRLPMRVLQTTLDGVARRWPQSQTAADFRVEKAVLDEEDQALEAASRIVTPHREIARLFPKQSVLLDWIVPSGGAFLPQTDGDVPRIYFPGPVAARKGAYALREALQGLDIELICGGSDLEGAGFWGPLKNCRGLAPGVGISAVVQPAFLEDQPRALLRAISSEIPVIASEACGLAAFPGIEIVGLGDTKALRNAVERLLAGCAV
jgi:hypothetical protein